MTNSEPKWHDIPARLHPVRCGGCGESWFCRTVGMGGNDDRDYWPRFCCYCGMSYRVVTPETPAGESCTPVGFDGKPVWTGDDDDSQ